MAIERNAKALSILLPTVTVYADADWYQITKSPRGRYARTVLLHANSEILAKADPLTNLQRALEVGKTLLWIPASVTVHDCVSHEVLP